MFLTSSNSFFVRVQESEKRCKLVSRPYYALTKLLMDILG